MIDIGALRSYSSTMLKQLERYLDDLTAAGSAIVLTGVTDDARRELNRTGLADKIGEQNILPPDPHLDVTEENGLRRGSKLLDELCKPSAP